MATTVDEYVGRRAETLAFLVLTRRKDVDVVPFGDRSVTGIDLFAQVSSMHKEKIAPSFGIRVVGTDEPLDDKESATLFAEHQWTQLGAKGLFLFPVVLFLFSVENDQGYFGWLMEPSIDEKGGPRLARVTSFDMSKINNCGSTH